MPRESPNVFTIPSSAPFLRTLIHALLDGKLVKDFSRSDDPLMLADVTLYLPTQRACRLARDTFLDVLGQDAALLPRLVPIGEPDEGEITFAEAGPLTGDALALPEAVGAIERTLLLSDLIRTWAEQPGVRTEKKVRLVASNPASILALAGDLGRLMDDFITRGADWNELDNLVPADLDEYWQRTLEFLQIARHAWPKMLAERGKIDKAERQKLIIAAEAKRLARTTSGPVIAAGSTGSTPTTANLLATIARLPRGAVVLPGLDTHLDAPSWDRIASDDKDAPHAYGHPQFALHGLLRQMGITRDAVIVIGPRSKHGREELVSEALRPAEVTDRWESHLRDKAFGARVAAAMDGMSVIAAAHPEDEALGIAVALREAVDDGTPESRSRTAALVTPDRTLARRVIAALARWNIPVDDSGGDRLGATPAGVFARLAAQVALGGAEPVPLLALLKHPLLRLGAHEFAHTRAIETLEFAILRGPRPQRGTDGLKQALAAFAHERLHHSDPRNAITPSDRAAADALVGQLADALAPLEKLAASAKPFAELAILHRDVIAALSKDAKGESVAFVARPSSDTGKLLTFFSEVEQTDCSGRFLLTPSDYAEAFQAAIAGEQVRRPGAPNARVRILGPLEARLLEADRVVLGGLVEGVWPPDPQTDPWLSRPMRRQLGLDLPERRIGLTAHDFAQALGAKKVILSHAAKRDGAPTVVSRFLQRLAAVAGSAGWKEAVDRGNQYLDWGRSLDEPGDEPRPCQRPAPAPPRDARPTSLTVTEIEHWLRDPYTIYARHILQLQPLDDIDVPPGLRDRGIVIHEALADFTKTFAKALPADPRAELLRIGEKYFAELAAYPEARAFWWPRFVRIADWFAGWETGRRENVKSIDAEIHGRLDIPLGERIFVLRTRADRIEHLPDGSVAILDYKTGRIPSDKQVKIGLSPQLTLEAAMLREGAFGAGNIGAPIRELVYVGVKGGRGGGEPRPVKFKDSAPDQEADIALARLKALVSRFDDDTQPYRSVPIPMWRLEYGAYDHLARIKEWSAAGDEETAE